MRIDILSRPFRLRFVQGLLYVNGAPCRAFVDCRDRTITVAVRGSRRQVAQAAALAVSDAWRRTLRRL